MGTEIFFGKSEKRLDSPRNSLARLSKYSIGAQRSRKSMGENRPRHAEILSRAHRRTVRRTAFYMLDGASNSCSASTRLGKNSGHFREQPVRFDL
jgi:hypothetical protein